MPINIPQMLPAYEALREEHVFVLSEDRAMHQDIRPLKVAICNLMPTTLDTEMQLLRLLGNTPLQVDITLVRMGSHESRNAPPGHLDKFYISSEEIMALGLRFDGLIVTGAPVETLAFEEVDYWPEIAALLDYSLDHVFSTFHICWGAQAGLYRHYGIPKTLRKAKLFGVFPHTINHHDEENIDGSGKTAKGLSDILFRGFDVVFYAPQSRHTESDRAAAAACPELTIESETDETGLFIVTARKGREIYVTGHLEYDPLTLDKEYRRDLAKGLAIAIPRNYYPGDDPSRPPLVRWRAHAHLFFSNWINYVYQGTPYDLSVL
jgi:homoserine O-succinyltransferase